MSAQGGSRSRGVRQPVTKRTRLEWPRARQSRSRGWDASGVRFHDRGLVRLMGHNAARCPQVWSAAGGTSLRQIDILRPSAEWQQARSLSGKVVGRFARKRRKGTERGEYPSCMRWSARQPLRNRRKESQKPGENCKTSTPSSNLGGASITHNDSRTLDAQLGELLAGSSRPSYRIEVNGGYRDSSESPASLEADLHRQGSRKVSWRYR